MNNYNFEGHKLAYHPKRLAQYAETGECFPLYAEISLVGSCNHRCLFCAYDFIGHPNRRLATGRLMQIIEDMAASGVKSIVLAGEGEPLLHRDIAEVIAHIRGNGIDVGLFTNGQAFNRDLAERLLPHLTFVRFSFNGGSSENYAKVHRVKSSVFGTVVRHMTTAAEIRKTGSLPVDIGAQFVLIPENRGSLYSAAITAKEAGLDYLAIKPFVLQRPEQYYKGTGSLHQLERDVLLEPVQALADERFAVIIRKKGFSHHNIRRYTHCRGCSFITVINSAGDVATCLPFWDKPDFVYGNIYEQGFSEIWLGNRRKALQHYLENTMDVQACPPSCRPDAINAYLDDIFNPTVRHVNFI